MPVKGVAMSPEQKEKLRAAARTTWQKAERRKVIRSTGNQPERLGAVYRALPGTLNQIRSETGYSLNTVRKYIAVLRQMGVADERRVNNSRGFGHAYEYFETPIKEGE
jgi:hypothetical protein